MLTPLPFVLFFTTTKRVIMNWFSDEEVRNFFITAIFIVGGFIALSFKTLVKMNWLLPGYLGLIIATILVFRDDNILKTGIFKAGVIISVILIIVAHSILLIPNIPLGEGNTWSGWQETAQNIYGEKALQFEIWGIPSSLKGKNALFICTDRREYKPQLNRVRRYFTQVSLLSEFDIFFSTSIKTRTIFYYYAKNYIGQSDPRLQNDGQEDLLKNDNED